MSTSIFDNRTTSSDPLLTTHWVIILAAGLSTRLGQPKQLLTIQGQPLIRHMTQLALATNPQKVIVVVPQGQPDINSPIADLAIELIINPNPATGMALSLSLAIDSINTQLSESSNASNPSTQTTSILIMGIDQVRLTTNHLQQLLQARAHPQTIVAASRYNNIIGLPLVVEWQQLQAWQSQLSGDKGLRKLIRSLPEHAMTSINVSELADDIDTPQQYAHACNQGWLDTLQDK